MYPKSWFDILDICLNKPTTKNVIMNFDKNFTFNKNDYHFETFPKYLYDNNIFNDVNYLLSKEIGLMYSLNTISKNLLKDWTDLDTLYIIKNENGSIYKKESVYWHYNNSEVPRKLIVQDYIENIDILCEYIALNRGVNFYFFFTPYSMAYWSLELKYNNIDDYKKYIYYSFSQLLKNDNCKMYLMSDQYSLAYISNLDNYSDLSHFDFNMNKYISECIGTDVNLLTKDIYEQKLDEFFNYIESYDYASMFIDLNK